MEIVRCNDCEWIGTVEDLVILNDEEHCPECNSSECLMDVEYGCIFSDEQLRKLWGLLSEIGMDYQDCTEESFLGFHAGTSRIEIWKWFDERYTEGVYELLCSSLLME